MWPQPMPVPKLYIPSTINSWLTFWHTGTPTGVLCAVSQEFIVPGIYNFGTGMGSGYKTTYYHLGYISLASTQREESSGASLVIWPSVFVEGACVTAWIVYC